MKHSSSVRVALFGVTGRMGKALLSAMGEGEEYVVAGALASLNDKAIGQPVVVGEAASEVVITSDARTAARGAQVAIDFTLPLATRTNVEACVAAGVPMVIGTTGLDESARQSIQHASSQIAIVQAANMSLGVNVLLKLVELAARTLDENYDIEIFEAHHRFKKDAPSGTALALGRAAAAGRGSALEALAEYARHGDTGARKPGAIGFSVQRGGDIIGDHVVSFVTLGERIELTHRAHDRMGFARGALAAARWVVQQRPGLYSMQDVLGLRPAGATG